MKLKAIFETDLGNKNFGVSMMNFNDKLSLIFEESGLIFLGMAYGAERDDPEYNTKLQDFKSIFKNRPTYEYEKIMSQKYQVFFNPYYIFYTYITQHEKTQFIKCPYIRNMTIMPADLENKSGSLIKSPYVMASMPLEAMISIFNPTEPIKTDELPDEDKFGEEGNRYLYAIIDDQEYIKSLEKLSKPI